MEKVRVAIIGAGEMANKGHCPSLVEFNDVEIVGICDFVKEKLEQTAERFKINKIYQDYRKMIVETKPDAVYILVLPHHMYDIAVYCLKNKLHIFVEKPPGITLEQTRQLSILAKENNCLTMVGFQRRFAPLSVLAKNRIEERGGIIQCEARFVKYYNSGPFYDGAVDILTTDGIHAVDNLIWMSGDIEKVVSDVRSINKNYDNIFNAFIKFKNGTTGFLKGNWIAGKRIFSIEMYGTGISCYVEPEIEALIYTDGKEEPEIFKAKDIAKSSEFYKIGGFFDENRHFIDCIKQAKQPMTNFSESLKTMKLIDLIYHSQF